MENWHLAQLNLARLVHPLDDPRIRDFVEGLEPINRLADESKGFVWRLQSGSGNATDIQHPWSSDPFLLVNMSVWKSPADLRDYVYRSAHIDYFRRRAEWFEKLSSAHYVLWWIPAGHIPSLSEAEKRLDHYRRYGDTERAFWFQSLFPPPVNSLQDVR